MSGAIIQRFATLSCRNKIRLKTSQIAPNLSLKRKILVAQAQSQPGHKKLFHVTSSLKNKTEENEIVTKENASKLQIKKSRNRIIINNKILKANVSSMMKVSACCDESK